MKENGEAKTPAELDLMTSAEVCEMMGVSRQALKRYRDKEGLPYFELQWNQLRYRRGDVMQWLKQRERRNV